MGKTSSALLSSSWTAAVSMSVARQNHVAALLPNGSLLVAGGHPGNNAPTNTAEIFSPATGTWTMVGSMGTARRLFGACTLPSGQVLVAGGNAGAGDVATAELFDPSTNTWSATGSLAAAREDFSMTCLSDGRVLVAGGSGPSGLLSSAEIYTPSSGTWSSAGTLPSAVHGQGAVRLGDGRVLIAGGNNAAGPVATAAIWTPSTNAWTATGSMATTRSFHALNILSDGRVIAAGGLVNLLLSTTSSAEIYNSSTGTWSAAAGMHTARYSGASATLAAGPIVIGGVNGGSPLATSESYDSVHNTWTQVPTVYGAVNQTATALTPASVLVAGGNTGSGATKSAQTYGILNVFALYAQRSVTLGTSDHINGGDVGVAAPAPSTFGPQLVVGGSTTVQTNHNLVAPSVSLGSQAHVGDVQTNTLTNSGGTLGTQASYPSSMPAPPIPLPTGGGGSNVSVPAFTITTLNPGNYGALSVTGTVYLNAGKYTFSSVTMANQAHLAGVSGTATVSVAGTFQAGSSVSISSPGGAPAGQLVISAAGYDSGSTPAFSIGTGAAMSAVLSAPHGTLAIGDSSIATGAFSGFDVKLGNGVTINYQNGFAGGASKGTQQLSGYVTAAMAAAPLVGPVPPSTPMSLAISLPVTNPTQLAQFIAAVSDPSNSQFRQYITPSTFASTYGAASSDVSALESYATAKGLTVKTTYPDNLLFSVSGTAAAVEQAFFVNLNYYLRPDGTQFFAPDRNPSLNSSSTVLRIAGLDNAFVSHPAVATGGSGHPATCSGCSGDRLSAADLRAAYVPCAPHLTGTGQVVALFEMDDFNATDMTTFNPNLANLIETYRLPGQNFGPSGDTEITGDIEMVNALAPDATIRVFEVQNGSGDGDVDETFKIMAYYTGGIGSFAGIHHQITSSWGFNIDDSIRQSLSQFAAEGISFFESSGDTGAYPIGINLDAALPFTTVTGGTVLSMFSGSTILTCTSANAPCTYNAEAPWTGSGGGFFGPIGDSTLFPFNSFSVPLPDFQQNIDMTQNGGSTQYRNVPDVSMAATNIDIFANGTWQGFGGTSASSPLWAAFTALANEQSVATRGGVIGYANPVLYKIGKAQFANPTAFSGLAYNDLSGGNNSNGGSIPFGSYFTAVPGYDLVTGWGSPQCGLINQLASRTPATPFSCGSGVSMCELACCPSGICTAGVCQPPPTFAFSTGSHVDQLGNVHLCVHGEGFTRNVNVDISISGSPAVSADRTVTTDGSGSFSQTFTFNAHDCFNTSACGNVVTITATDAPPPAGTGRSLQDTEQDFSIWCSECSGPPGMGVVTCN